MNHNAFLDPAHAGVFYLAPERWEAVRTAAHQAEWPTAQSRIKTGDKEGVLRELGASLNFPGWYGANLDALYDCLTDPDVLPSAVVLLSGLSRLSTADPEAFSTLIKVLASAADSRRDSGQPLWLLLDTTTPGIPEFPCP